MTAAIVRVPAVRECGVCGYVKTYATEGLAVHHFPRHSCENQRTRDARAVRVVTARTRDGVRRDCQCPIAHHEHGTRTAYVVDRCRCRPCTDASAQANAARNKAHAYGRYDSGRVDAEPVREHMRFLLENGISLKQMAVLTGLSLSTIGATLYGRSERGHKPYARTSRNTAQKLLAIRPTLDNMAAARVIGSTGTHRRLQALVTIGWSMARLGERLGIAATNMSIVMKSPQVTAGRARDVIALYEELWDQPQDGHDQRSRISASRAKRYATAHRWVPPMAWEGLAIDDPATVPDMGDTDKTTARIENIEHLLATGHLFWEVAQRLDTTEPTLERFLHRNHRYDIVTTARTQERNNNYRRVS